ncbi:MAG: alpha-E domain-containing protein, partial [Chloroflexaceae bacterium]|nr:alpha-E domain-containing protein [Chloroflexaceae bacterium]
LYWMSRYLERAEHTARLLDVNLDQMLDDAPQAGDLRWRRLLEGLRIAPPSEHIDLARLIRWLTVDQSNEASIVYCIAAARENARQVREQISSEMWQHLNQLYLQVKRTSKSRLWRTQPHKFFQMVKEGSHLFQGITDATMSHGEGWQFIQVGRSLERIVQITLLLDAYYRTQEELDYLAWVGLLRSCTAFEAYCQFYTADVQPHAIAEFLLLNERFPHSVRFCADQLQDELNAVSRAAGVGSRGRVERLAGRLRASLDYAQVDEIMQDLHPFLNTIHRQCNEVHAAIYSHYIDYSVDAALSR